MTGLAVTIRGLVHVYRTEGQDVAALSGVDLVIRAGETVCLLGPSGSGKSTLLSLLGGLQRPSAGSISIGTRSLAEMSEADLAAMRAGQVGFVVQGGRGNLVPYLDAHDNVLFAQSMCVDGGKALPAPTEVLDLVGAGDLARRTPEEMSLGDAQLVAIAVAMGCAPGLLLADEPTAALSRDARGRVLEAMVDVNRRSGVTVVAVSHDAAVAAAMRRTVTIRDGRVGAEGRGGLEFAVISADGSLPLPAEVLDHLPPGTEVRVGRGDDGWWIRPAESDGEVP